MTQKSCEEHRDCIVTYVSHCCPFCDFEAETKSIENSNLSQINSLESDIEELRSENQQLSIGLIQVDMGLLNNEPNKD